MSPTLAEVVDRVRRRPLDTILTPFPDARSSAVLVLLHDGDDGPEVLLTKRSMNLRSHRGEISFPGGRMEPGESPVDAAMREAFEEVALDPRLALVVGELDHLSTVTSNSSITPIVATIEERPTLVAWEAEVERILWVSLAELTRADTYREERWGAPPLDRPIYFFELDDETVWGATGRMLHQLLSIAHDPPT